MRKLGRFLAFMLALKVITFLIARGLTLEIMEKFNENNNKL